MTTTHGAIVVVVALGATLFGVSSCRRDGVEPTISETTLTSASTDVVRTTTETAVPELADAECKRQLECERGTSGAEYRTLSECVKHLRRDLALELDPASTCAGGIDRERLERCLATVRGRECGAASSDQAASAVACRGSELCPRVMSP